MVQRLGHHFPDTWTCSWKRFWQSLKVSDADVLVFFDFMALPQISKNDDGTIIERTKKEQLLFCEALPEMGTLYTMLQVMVLPEVSPGVHSYSSSGWCFSEFQSALLMQKLNVYSATFTEQYLKESITQEGLSDDSTKFKRNSNKMIAKFKSRTITAESLENFTKWFERELALKCFHCEADREIVRGIVLGFLLRRRLKDAILSQQVGEVQQLLLDHRKAGLGSTINQALDEMHNTLLHVAARLPSMEITHALLEAGADPEVRNLRGDQPLQLFMWPRMCSGGAKAVRKYLSNKCKTVSSANPVVSNEEIFV